MKKILSLITIFAVAFFMVGCKKKAANKLYILNVGDYMDDSLVQAFEKKYNCDVVYTEKSSNEEIYYTLQHDKYDICVISDYMVDRMRQEGSLEEIDFSKIPNYKTSELFPDALNLLNTQCKDYSPYMVPYFWGSVGILYNTSVSGLAEYVHQKGLLAVFENNSYRVGMYDSARDAICLCALAYGESNINTADEAVLRAASQKLKSCQYPVWGDDDLKSKVHSGEIDMALVYSGDYLDELYQIGESGEEENIDYYAPESTNVWIDGLAILKNSENKEMAYAFIDFINSLENAAQNADFIGYCPLSKEVKDLLFKSEEEGGYGYDYDDDHFYPFAAGRQMYKYVSNEHYDLLNVLLEEAKSK